MAKKGGVQQLQAELNNDEDFERYIEKYFEAVIVFDVYTDWCGPCLGAVNALRKIKMELGGDDLQLAICKSDNISRLNRFYKKSEPSWLFVREGKSINLMLGSNIPKLLELIKYELKRLKLPMEKIESIEIEELYPEEKKRLQAKLDIIAAVELKERRERQKKRRDYLMMCTDSILENLPDVGVTIFGPQVPREMFKKINEPADALKIACKAKTYQYVTREDFNTVNFACPNPLPDDVIEELTKQEILICFWKISEESKATVPQVMNQYVYELTKRVVEPADELNAERLLPPIIAPIKVKVFYEVDVEVECPEIEEDEEKRKTRASIKPLKVEEEATAIAEIDYEGEEEDVGEGKEEPQLAPAMDMPLDFNFGDILSDQGEEEEDIGEIVEVPPATKICSRTVYVPPVWTPSDERTHAALIYVFFRVQTLPFLQPDPPPEPPHVIMAFNTYKKRDLISIAERNKADIPCYGFFTNDDAEEAEFIANSAQKYAHHTPSPTDKLVFKVNKRTSHMMLSLASYGATYVSPNTIIGKEEALKFFPESYRTAEQDRLEALEAQKKATVEPEPVPVKAKGKKKAGEGTKSFVKFQPEVETFDVEDFPETIERAGFGEGETDGEADEGYGGEYSEGATDVGEGPAAGTSEGAGEIEGGAVADEAGEYAEVGEEEFEPEPHATEAE